MTNTDTPRPGDLTAWLAANAQLWDEIRAAVARGHAYDAVAREVMSSAIAELTPSQLGKLAEAVRGMPGPEAPR